MKYTFGKGEVKYPTGLIRRFPTLEIEDALKYGWYFNAEIQNLSSNLNYVREIVDKLKMLLNGEIPFYEGFGFEVYMIECDQENAKVINIFEDDKLEATIPTIEVYDLMRDWRDYLIEWNNSQQK